MERLDYRINEDGLERWISHDKVTNIVGFLCPALANEILVKMRVDEKPFEFEWDGKKCRIEYKGPRPGNNQVANLLTSMFMLCVVALSGCTQFKKLTGTEKKVEDKTSAFYVVACCRDNDGAGNMSYPSFVPQSHVDLCERVRLNCHTNDCQINGDTWLATSNPCEMDYKIGSQYYKGRGY